MKTKIFDVLPSTNEYAETHDFLEDTAIIAREQTGGKGTKGRSFSSLKGGVYLSLVRLMPCNAADSFSVMVASCMAVVKTLESYGVKAQIKWANDVFVNGKKICGILIKNIFEGDYVKKSITGIGVNVNNEIPPELQSIAINLKSLIGKVDTDEFSQKLIENLYKHYSIDEYRSYNMVLGRRITVIDGEKTYAATASDISPNGNLVLSDGKILSHGEVTIRL